jgi:hypothetical protein
MRATVYLCVYFYTSPRHTLYNIIREPNKAPAAAAVLICSVCAAPAAAAAGALRVVVN